MTLVGFGVAWWYMEPPPPDTLVIAAGRQDGAYHRYATEYASILAEHGIRLEVRETAGSVENFTLLADDPTVDLAIVQGGTAPAGDRGFESLTGLYLEPVLIFTRKSDDLEQDDLRDLRGRRVAVGGPGSGTRAAATSLFEVNGIEDGRDGTEFVALGGTDAADALQAGEVDAALLVLAVTDPIVEDLLRDERLVLLPVRNEAYRRRFRYLEAVTLPRGVVDLERDLPPWDVPMIAPVAKLVATKDLHEAFVPLLLGAVRRVHGPGDVLTEPGLFPSTTHAEFPVNGTATRWYESGPSFLYRALPFPVASTLDRMKILLLPALTLLLPLVKVAPPVIRWRIRSSIYKWYRVLRSVEEELRDGAEAAELERHLATLAALQTELDGVSVPLSYMEEFYNLRLHIDLVRRDLTARLAGARVDDDRKETVPFTPPAAIGE